MKAPPKAVVIALGVPAFLMTIVQAFRGEGIDPSAAAQSLGQVVAAILLVLPASRSHFAKKPPESTVQSPTPDLPKE